MATAFGAPAPLPGQPGFRARPSESMARETAEMEERLSRLKTDLAVEAEMREAAGPRAGGARWRSARIDRGSVRAYAKDVKIRHKQQLQKRPPHGIFANKSAEQRVRPSPAFASKEVTRWGVGDTLGWLDSLGLEKYRSVFQQNEISGTILLEVGLDDLDYMDVRVLAHRKRILKGIEDLRRGGRKKRALDANMPPPPAPALELLPNQTTSSTRVNRDEKGPRGEGIGEGGAAAETTSQIAPEDCGGVGRRYSPLSGGNKQHWSTIKPLSENQRDGGGLSPTADNLADGQYDESAASSSFKDAVAEWRGEGKYSTTTSATEGRASSLHRPAVVGRAPLAGMPSAAEEEKYEDMQLVFNAKPARPGLLGGREGGRAGMGEETECWVNPFSSPRIGVKGDNSQLVDLGHEPGVSSHGTETLTVAGSKQQQGVREKGHDPALALDEEAEHEAFRKAVAEWNRGKNTGVTADGSGVRDGSASGRGIGGISSAQTATEVEIPSRRTAEAMAEELRKQMDAEHCSQAKELEEEKRALLEGLERSREGETKGDQLELGAPDGGTEVEEQDDDASWREREDARSVGPSSVCSSTGRSSGSDRQDAEAENIGCGGHDSSGVEIEVVESVLGADLSIEGGVSYVVDECDSGDEPHF
ncbi:conserved unknown protein [Ectocarpus siliculosus]|uniref:SAM domain-containing protein n=1 Tax=Ectocarpus siliculosus TaxID=2880 RepID=D8LH25_ECTSI|nr:conserved unknown protein [Ectocarpus siliculosus]|eukprot:CBN75878.1 conserved unknown protein [Ectocarpus siliculosus]